jgi:Trypsin-like peptidase domain
MDEAVALESLVNILRNGQDCGMGVFTEHGRVVTARHCVNDALATAERIVRVSKFTDPTVFVDMAVEWYDDEFAFDVAILKPLFPVNEAFTEFQRRLTVARFQSSLPEPHLDFDVHMFRRDPQGWVKGKSRLHPESEMVEIDNNPKIEIHKGTSGSPVFSDSGEVIGLAMLSTDDGDEVQGIKSKDNSRNPIFTLLGPVIPYLKSRSFRGSQRHLFDLIVSPHFEETVNNLLLGTGAVLAAPDCRCPNRADLTEAQLEDYFVNHPHPSGFILEAEWWFLYRTNLNRRPVWDLVCHIVVAGKPGLLLV